MKRLIIGMGNVGCEIARRWRDQGIEVVGTTTTPSKVDGLLQYANLVEVVRGTDTH